MTVSRSLLVAALVVAFATSACTVLSGIDGLELRTGARGDAAAEPSDSSVPDAPDAPDARTPDATVVHPMDASDAPCSTAQECQDERCRQALPDSRIAGEIGKTLSVTATCTAGTPFVIAPGPSHYYGAKVRCTLAPQPAPAAVASFGTRMDQDGWHGFTVVQEATEQVVVGESTTQLCSMY